MPDGDGDEPREPLPGELPVAEATPPPQPPPDLTDKLNRKLLSSFLMRLNNGEVPLAENTDSTELGEDGFKSEED